MAPSDWALNHRRAVAGAAIVASVVLMFAAGCSVPFPITNDNSDNSNDDPGSPQPAPEPLVMLRLVNGSDAAVDAEIFVSSNSLADPATELFTEDHRFNDSIGLAGTGLLVPGSADSVIIDCAEGLTVGTSGGRFLDVEDGEELGTGTPRILQEEFVFDCGDVVTLVYFFRDDTYGVDVALE